LTADQCKRIEKNFGMSLEQFAQKLKQVWDRDVEIGIKTGHLSRRADGAIVGKGNPLDWFDAVNEKE
jgi:hypothetical protein